MAKLSNEDLSKIDFNDDETICPKCGAHGVFIPPSKAVDGTLVANFECNNGHPFTKKYPLK